MPESPRGSQSLAAKPGRQSNGPQPRTRLVGAERFLRPHAHPYLAVSESHFTPKLANCVSNSKSDFVSAIEPPSPTWPVPKPSPANTSPKPSNTARWTGSCGHEDWPERTIL